MKNAEFYDFISSNYDEMINFESSLNKKIQYLKNFISSEYNNALDLGCGTGADSIALSKLGLSVDAVDHSSEMLELAGRNAERFNLKIDFIESGLINYHPGNKRYDIIVSLGNTMSNISASDLKSLFKNLSLLLKPGGRVLIQIINYAKLPSKGIYILSEFENEFIHIKRKYNINEDHIDFIISKVNKVSNERNEIITRLFPHSKEDLMKIAVDNKMKVQFFGNLLKEDYLENESENLIALIKNEKT